MKKVLLIVAILATIVRADFVRSAAGVVTDTITGLEWQDNYNDNGDTIKSAKWTDAIAYCEASTLDGTGWRLPNLNELSLIVDRTKAEPTISTVFTKTNNNIFWSATTYQVTPATKAWSVSFSMGDSDYVLKTDDSKYIRCVRG